MKRGELSGTSTRIGAWLAVLLLIAAVGSMVAATLGDVSYLPASDEGYCLRSMQEVASQGLGALPGQFLSYLRDEKLWTFHPPSRVGFTLASAVLAHVTGPRMETLSYLSLGSHLALIAVQFVFARRSFGDEKAVLATALTAFSPLCLGLSRLALPDSFISLSQVTAIWLFVEYVRAPFRRKRQVAFMLAFWFAMLAKESSLLLVLPFAAYAGIERFLRCRDVPIGRTALVLVAPAIGCLLAGTLAAGSPVTFFKVMKIAFAPPTSEYALRFCSGGWYRYPIDQLLMSPWPTLLGLAAIALTAWRWRQGEYGTLAVAMSLVYAGQIGALSPFTKSLRHVAVLETPLRILAVTLLWETFRAKSSVLGRWTCAAAIALLCRLDYQSYEQVWLVWRTHDPVTAALVMARGLITAQPPGE